MSDEEKSGVDEPDEDLYSEGGREELMEEDEIDELEEGFMQGYEGGDKMAKCALCDKILASEFVEEEINGEIYRFCSDKHAEIYKKKIK